LAKGGIAPRLYSPCGSSNVQLYVLAGWGLTSESPPFHSSNTMCRWTAQVYLPNGI